MTSSFSSHIDLAHSYWKAHVREGDCVIDATCGNGHDTLFLAQLVGSSGLVIGLDIQEQALANTKTLLLKENLYERISLHKQSHESFPEDAYLRPISLLVYNLGYLPGGNKQLTTRTATTLASLEKSLELLSSGGLLSVTCYPGHPEGETEERAVIAWMEALPPFKYAICHHRWVNRRLAPSLAIIQKKI